MNERGLVLQRNYVTFQDGGPQKIHWSKQITWCESYIENYQIWAVDVNTSWRKLLFKINIVRQPRFPLRNEKSSPCFHSLVKTWRTFVRIREQISKNQRCISPAEKFSQTLPRFSSGHEERWSCFISFIKLFFSEIANRKRWYTKPVCIIFILSWNCKFLQLGDS